MTKALLVAAALIALVLPLTSHAVIVIDPGLGGPPNEPDTDRANGPDLGGQGDVADDFQLTMGRELYRVTFWAYLQVGATWVDNWLDYRLALNDNTTNLPMAEPYKDSTGKIAAGRVQAQQDPLGSGIDAGPFYINNQANYDLNQYSFDLGGIGILPGVTYWLVLRGEDTTGGENPGATDLLWAYNDQPSGTKVYVPSLDLWFSAGGGSAFDFRTRAPLPPTLTLILAGLLGFRMLNRAPRVRPQPV